MSENSQRRRFWQRRPASGIFDKERVLNVLLATGDPAALAALAGFQTPVQRTEAFSTGGVYARIAGQNLVIADLQALAETDAVSREALRAALESSRVAWCTPAQLAAAPLDWETQALTAIGAIDALPPKAVAFVSFSGGVGKTTFALDLARYVAAHLRLSALVVELTHGVSSIRTLLDADLPHLYQVMTQSAQPGRWQGVTMLPMEYELARLLLGRAGEVTALLARLKGEHILTVFDCEPDHEFWPQLAPLVDECYGVTTPRADAVANAARALDVLEQHLSKAHSDGAGAATRVNGAKRPKTGLIVNQLRMADRIALASLERVLDVPFVDHLSLNGTIARRVLPVIYPGWRG